MAILIRTTRYFTVDSLEDGPPRTTYRPPSQKIKTCPRRLDILPQVTANFLLAFELHYLLTFHAMKDQG
jgi:hypothetical protein